MSIELDGGINNANIREIQQALADLGADIEVNGILSNTTIHRIQAAINALAGEQVVEEDGGLGSDAIRELQIAVNALSGGGAGTDPGAPFVDLNMRELDGATYGFGSRFLLTLSGGVPAAGAVTLNVTGDLTGSVGIAWDDDSDDIQAALDVEFGVGAITVDDSAGGSFGDTQGIFAFTVESPIGAMVEVATTGSTLNNSAVVDASLSSGPLLSVWPDVQGWGLKFTTGAAYSTGGTFDLTVNGTTETFDFDVAIADVVTWVEGLGFTSAFSPITTAADGGPPENAAVLVEDASVLYLGFTGATPTFSADLSSLVQGDGPGLTSVELGPRAAAIIDQNDGSSVYNGFTVSLDDDGTVLTGNYADNDSRMTCPVDLTQFAEGWTVYSLRKVGFDAPDDGSEMCPDTFGPDDEAYYNDAYCYADDRESSSFYDGRGLPPFSQYGGPQRGDVYLWTQSWDPTVGNFGHVDGPALDPQTVRGPTTDPDLTAKLAGGVMLANYPGGGYCMPGPYVRFLVYPGAHTEANRLFVRRMLRDANAGTDYAFTLRDEQVETELVFSTGASYSTGGTFDATVNGETETFAFDATVGDFTAWLESLGFSTVTILSAHELPIDPSELIEDSDETHITVSGIVAVTSASLDLTNLVQGDGPGLISLEVP